MTFVPAAQLEELWSGEMRGVQIEGKKVLLVHVEGDVRAFENRCLHQAVELSRGRLDCHVLTCSAHEWQYDVRTGAGINPRNVQLPMYPVQVRDGVIYVDVGESGGPS